MNKFKRYLAVVFCLLLSLMFISVPDMPDNVSVYGSKHPTYLTPYFDNTAITKLGFLDDPSWKLWRYATSYLNTCTQVKSIEISTNLGEKVGACSDFGEALIFLRYSRELRAELIEQSPSLLGKFDAAFKSNQQEEGWKTHEFRQLYDLHGKAMIEYLDSVRGRLATMIYIFNFGLMGFILIGIVFRQTLGNFLWLPFAFIGTIFSTGAKAAKGIHDKI